MSIIQNFKGLFGGARMEALAQLRTAQLKRFIHNDRYAVLAFDHRGSFIKMMQEHTDRSVEVGDAIILKEKVIATLAPHVSGMLIDEEYGLPAYRQANSTTPYLLPAEKTGYTDARGERITEIQRSALELKNQGASGVKLLLYVHHQVPSWKNQMHTAKKVIADAHGQGLPVFLEFVLYQLEGYEATSVVACVEKACSEGVSPDVWKLPYPGSIEASQKVTQVVGTAPWVLLTGGSTFTEFADAYTSARTGGCAGFVAGRSLWQEACSLFEQEKELQAFLQETLVARVEAIAKL